MAIPLQKIFRINEISYNQFRSDRLKEEAIEAIKSGWVVEALQIIIRDDTQGTCGNNVLEALVIDDRCIAFIQDNKIVWYEGTGQESVLMDIFIKQEQLNN